LTDKKGKTTKEELTDEEKRKRIEDTVYGKVRNLFGKPLVLFGVFAYEDDEDVPVMGFLKGDAGLIPEALATAIAAAFPREAGEQMDTLLQAFVQELVWQVAVKRGDVVLGEDGNYYMPLTQDVSEEMEMDSEMENVLSVLTGGKNEEVDEGGEVPIE